jgi:hypothetical protein
MMRKQNDADQTTKQPKQPKRPNNQTTTTISTLPSESSRPLHIFLHL